MFREKKHIINRLTAFSFAMLLSVFSASGQLCDLNADLHVNSNCSGVVSFLDQSTSSAQIIAWAWDFGDGSPIDYTASPSHQYLNAGIYNVKLVVADANGCVDTALQSLNMPGVPQPLFVGDTLVCQGTPVNYSNVTDTAGVNVDSWFWQAGDGGTATTTDLAYMYMNSGTYMITLNANYGQGCVQSYSRTITVVSSPVPKLDIQVSCSDNIVHFVDTAHHAFPISNYNWDFGDYSYSSVATPSHYYANSGTYNVSLTVTNSNGCQGVATSSVTLSDPLSIDFNDFQVCDGDSVLLNGAVTSGTVPVDSWDWDLGDGHTANGQAVSHQYASPGTYMVTLTVTDTNGCTSMRTHSNKVVANPQAQFKGDPIFFGVPTEFVDQSQAVANPITSKYWDFGDGSAPQACVQDTTLYVYPSPGTYDATLFVADSLGCNDTARGLMEVWSNYVKANWVADTVCSGQLTQFADQSMVGSGDIVSWYWSFGDNASSHQQNPVHSYDTAGVFQVVLIITTDLGVTDSAKASVLVYDSPEADFDFTNACEEDKKVFYNYSSIPAGGGIVAYEWDLGDGTYSSQKEPGRVYYTSGSYEVNLVITSGHGCVDSVKHIVNVGSKPRVSFGASDYMGCEAKAIHFTDSSTISDGQIQSWQWEFGDGYVDTAPRTTAHSYVGVGTYNVTLTLVTDMGCSATKMIPSMIDIHPNPVAEFDFHPNDADVHRPTVYFHNNSIGGDEYYWTFGDGNSVKTYEPVYNYTRPGTFTITLVAETFYGCTNVKKRDITVTTDPVFFVPDAFTPNGDGRNDFFEPVGTGYNEYGNINYTMQIFDRAGNLVYDSPQIAQPWDGRIRGGGNAPEGVYVCRIVHQDITGKQDTYVGRITLMR